MDIYNHPKIKLLKRDKKYVFFIIDDPGSKPIISSKPYNTKTSRDKGALALIRNLDRLEKKKKEDKFYFVIKGGNNKQIGKSITFDTRQEMDQAIHLVKMTFQSTEDESQTHEMDSAEPGKEIVAPKSTDLPPKYSFRLQFYPPGSSEPLRGKIEYPFSKEKKTFKGLDIAAIESFIQTYLPEEALTDTGQELASNPSVSSPEDEPKEMPAPVETETSKAEKDQQGILTPDSATVHYDLISSHTGQKNNLQYKRSDPVVIQFNAGDLQFSREAYPYLAVNVYSTSMNYEYKQQLGQLRAKTDELRMVNVPLQLDSLSTSGAYKIDVLVQLIPKEKSIHPFFLIGTRNMQVY